MILINIKNVIHRIFLGSSLEITVSQKEKEELDRINKCTQEKISLSLKYSDKYSPDIDEWSPEILSNYLAEENAIYRKWYPEL